MIKSKYTKFRDLILSRKVNGKKVNDKKIAEIIGNDCTRKRVSAVRHSLLHPKRCKKRKDDWRKNNPKKLCQSRKNYRNPSRKSATNSRDRYKDTEKLEILTSDKTARELSEKFGRSIDGIFSLQRRLRKEDLT